MPRYLVTTVVRELHYIDAATEEEAIRKAVSRDKPDDMIVSDRYAEEETSD